MAKIKAESLLSIELEKLENKVNEFQQYLEENSIITKVTRDSEIIIALEEQDKLHKEIVIQIKMQDALFNWMPLLEKLREGSISKKLETRGNVKLNGLFTNKREEDE
jgi:thiamine kinase-like enzyme